jgi:hypothetical protein
MGQKAIECGKLMHKIVEPTITINGRTLPYASTLGDMSGGCPASQPSCFPPWLNIVSRGNAICHAYGFGDFAHSNDWGIWRSLPDEMAALVKNNGKWSPRIVRINHNKSEYAYVKNIWCYPNYSKR